MRDRAASGARTPAAPSAPSSGPRLLPAHRQHLLDGGLTEATIAAMGLRSVTDPEEARELLGWRPGGRPPVPAIVFDYGAGYVRLRPDPEVRRIKESGDEVRYDAPPERPWRMYIPTAICSAITNPSVGLWLTEGEKKALVSCQLGFPTVAAPGVWNFHDRAVRRASGIWQLHPDLRPLVTPGRDVTVLFDADIDDPRKVQIAHAAARLLRMVAAVEAVPWISYLPANTGAKGLDDYYIYIGGDEGMYRRTVLDARRPGEPHAQIAWLAGRWDGWAPEGQERELRRAVWLAWFYIDGEDAFEAWATAVAEGVGVPLESVVRHSEILPRRPGGRRPGPAIGSSPPSSPASPLVPGHHCPIAMTTDELLRRLSSRIRKAAEEGFRQSGSFRKPDHLAFTVALDALFAGGTEQAIIDLLLGVPGGESVQRHGQPRNKAHAIYVGARDAYDAQVAAAVPARLVRAVRSATRLDTGHAAQTRATAYLVAQGQEIAYTVPVILGAPHADELAGEWIALVEALPSRPGVVGPGLDALKLGATARVVLDDHARVRHILPP